METIAEAWTHLSLTLAPPGVLAPLAAVRPLIVNQPLERWAAPIREDDEEPTGRPTMPRALPPRAPELPARRGGTGFTDAQPGAAAGRRSPAAHDEPPGGAHDRPAGAPAVARLRAPATTAPTRRVAIPGVSDGAATAPRAELPPGATETAAAPGARSGAEVPPGASEAAAAPGRRAAAEVSPTGPGAGARTTGAAASPGAARVTPLPASPGAARTAAVRTAGAQVGAEARTEAAPDSGGPAAAAGPYTAPVTLGAASPPGWPGVATSLLQFSASRNSPARSFLPLELRNFDVCHAVTMQSPVSS